ncbi:MAG: hypothetical protein AAGA96_07760 [Verrucomicrobiota bacterium]
MDSRAKILNWRVLILLLAVVFIAAGALWFNRAEILLYFKSKQATQHLDQALAALEQNDYKQALRLAEAANQLTPNQIEILRPLFKAHASTASPQILDLAATVYYHPAATSKDRSQSLAQFLNLGDQRLFWRNYQALPNKEKRLSDNLFLLAGYYASIGNAELAFGVLEQGPKDDIRFQILRTALMAVSRDVESRRSAQEDLAGMIQTSDPGFSDLAFRQIKLIPIGLREPQILKAPAEEWMKNKSPGSLRVSDRLVILTFRWFEAVNSGTQTQAERIVEEVISEIGSNHPILISQWLLELQLWDAAYDLAEEHKQTKKDEKSLQYLVKALTDIQLRALAEASKWEEQIQLLSDSESLLPPLQFELMLAVANRELNHPSKSKSHWQNAFRLASLNASVSNSFLDIYDWANRNEQADIAIRAMAEAAKNPRGILPSTSELTQLMIFLAEQGRDDDLVAITNGLFKREAFGDVLLNNAIYLRELTGNPVPGGIEALVQISRRAPGIVGYQTTLILALINQERYEEAQKLAESITKTHRVTDLPPAESVIIAGAFRLVGKKNYFAEENLEPKMKSLMKIERQAFRDWFAPESSPDADSARQSGSN